MLKDWTTPAAPKTEELQSRLAAAQKKFAAQQMLIKEKKLPVLVLVEGWGTAGKGFLIGQTIKDLDPRIFKVASMGAPTEEERRRPFLYHYFAQIPEGRADGGGLYKAH